MAFWIKANTLVVEHIGMTSSRNQLRDGNWLLYQNDLLKLNMGSLVHAGEICETIGALMLNHDQAKQEQDGLVVRSLPIATDRRFVINQSQQIQADGEVDNGESMITDSEDVECDSDSEENENSPLND